MNNLRILSIAIATFLITNPYIQAQTNPPKTLSEIAQTLDPGSGSGGTGSPSCHRSEIYECVIISTEVVTYEGSNEQHCEGEIGVPDLRKLKPCKGCGYDPEIRFNECRGRISTPMSNVGQGGCTPEFLMGEHTLPNGKKLKPWRQPRPKFGITCEDLAVATPAPTIGLY